MRICGLDSYGTQIGNVGIRTRAAGAAEFRTQARFSDVSDFYIKSSKLPGEGSAGLKRVIGVVINAENTHISNGPLRIVSMGFALSPLLPIIRRTMAQSERSQRLTAVVLNPGRASVL